MTFSLLARDPETGALGGAAATGNLCVGAWVLRGTAGVGISASQGHFPSTLWGEDILTELAKGAAPEQAVQAIVSADPGRASRQLLVLDKEGSGAAFSGQDNIPAISELVQPDICAAGNMLSKPDVIAATVQGYVSSNASFARRLLAGLIAGAQRGGDARGLMSAAILILAPDHAPINLRIDFADTPLRSLEDLIIRTEAEDYEAWRRALPTRASPWSEI